MPVFTDAGKAITTNRIIGSGTEPKFIGWGTGTTAEASTQTALVTESAETSTTRVTGTSTRVTTTVTNDTYQVVGTVTASATRAITEAALFDAVSTGNMFMRALFTVINLASADSIQFTMQVKYA